MTERKRLVLWAATGGALVAVCWLPFGLAPLLPLALLPLVRGLRLIRRPRDAVFFGMTFAIVGQAVGGHYLLVLLKYSWLAIIIMVIEIAFFVPYGILAAVGAFWIGRRAGLPITLVFPFVYSPLEWLRTLSDLSLPSDQFAHVFGTHPQWLSWTPWTGPFFISFLALSVAALVDAAIGWRRQHGRAAVALLAAAILWAAPPLTDRLSARDASGPHATLRVGIVQPAVRVEQKLDKSQWPAVRKRLEQLTREAAAGADLVVWPETARPGPVIWRVEEPFSDPLMEALARRIGVPILYGCEIALFEGGEVVGLYNAAALARPDGRPTEWYGKQRLLPFVEGFPFADLVGWDPAKRRRKNGGKRSFLTLVGNFRPGPQPTVFEVGPARIGALICYEGFYEQLVRRYRRAGANALFVMTNDAWWGRSVFPRWLAVMAGVRAREADVPVLRAANSGISSLTNRDGRMVAATEIQTVATLQVPLEPSDSPRAGGARFAPARALMAASARLRVGLALVVLAGLALAARWLPLSDWAGGFIAWVDGLGPWAPVVFVLIYALVTVLCIPTWGLSIGGGALFGVALGIPVVLISAAAGATVAFLLGRTLMRGPVERWMGDHARMQAVDREISRRGWLVAALLRLSPLVPYNVLNYALGLTSLSFVGYLVSLTAMLPVLALYVGIGAAVGDAALGGERTRTPAEWALLGLGVLATLIVTAWLGRVATRRLPEAGGDE
jgi:apolipoprotein N-acyltransferase